ncbi:cytochrome P460 family protein [Marinobacterium aestuariivivens]|uniref:Cytochrome P460 family protein n=1 Tax=Marinobacterium aestuariivivens TaxID=1698799 RepID=A0ABW2A4K8_9GAMM
MNTLLKTTLAAALLASAGPLMADTLADETYGTLVGADGTISLPEGFRQHWTHLGSWIVADTSAPGAGFHDVYTQPEAAQAYRESGHFPDGTVLVKEIRAVASGEKTTGMAQWAGEPAVWFLMVKDAKGRFDGPHWGEGWGWALYEAKDPATNVSKSFEETCRGCHVPAQQNDWVFVEGYPTLK